ncbi:hypothetical protein [uncultured Pseudosulfitobacter sp.]|uniref:hypothetical protein n=1 Tax=uncultured Pseudosulfitobacter sp. TaxID=2854214 RepID=UPI0030DA52F9|tara:strand:+ start:258 stop:641 length:384 start_codon:yes stop_codon:yes gene_type:complete
MIRAGLIALAPLAACSEPEITAERLIPDYRGVQTSLLDNDLVQFDVEMTNALSTKDVSDYAQCAAAGYTLIRGYGFARHVRTNVNEEGGVWQADAVYTISPSLPRGLRTIDAEVEAANCAEKGIPTV